MCDKESPSKRERIRRSLAFSPDIVVCPSPTALLNSVSNLDWSGAVMKDSLIFGMAFAAFLGSCLRPAGFGVPPVWNEAAISLNPVGCGFIAAGGWLGPLDCAGELD